VPLDFFLPQVIPHMAIFDLFFFAIQDHLSQYKDNNDFSQKQMVSAIYQKLDSYWPILDGISQILSLFDPRTKLIAFKNLDEKTKAITLVSNLNGYSPIAPIPTTTSNELSNTRNYFRQLYLIDSQQESNSSSSLPVMNCI